MATLANAVNTGNGAAKPVENFKSKMDERDILKARIAELEAKLAAAPAPGKVTFAISKEKKALMALGLGQYPTTLYGEQWLRLIDAIEAQNVKAMIIAALKSGALASKASK
jgi:hypothetical protein